MIVSLYLRHFKIYKGINFIPLSFGNHFSTIIGENGVGKSSVLEALDFAMNKKDQKDWSVNNEAKSEGNLKANNYPFVAPIFLIPKSLLRNKTVEDKALFDKAEAISDFFWNTKFKTKAKGLDEFYEQRNVLKETYEQDEYFLILIGKKHFEPGINFGSFHTALDFVSKAKTTSNIYDEAIQEYFNGFYDYIVSHYSYMHIPVETDPNEYTKLETQTMQKLMDKDIQQEIENAITKRTINQINSNLDSFVKDIETILGTYKYKGKYKNSLTMPDLVSKIIEAYFSIKVLNKKGFNDKLVPVYDLSSGEKRKALVDIAYSFLKRNVDENKLVILAIDEPEASLHISACFPQFERLMELAGLGNQVIVSSHWYGFIPITLDGTATSIRKDLDGQINVKLFDLYNYREHITQARKETKGPLPFDINLKSYNDLVQSIIISLMSDSPYNWIICEGLSEKIYFEYFFKDEIANANLRILPVGGYKDVKKVYDNLIAPISDPDYEVIGKVFCLIDTDAQSINVNYKKVNNLAFERVVTDEKNKKTTLVTVDSNMVNPVTTIEDCLDPQVFKSTLLELIPSDLPLHEIITNAEIMVSNESSANCMDLKKSEEVLLKNFFEQDCGENKVIFAKKYIELSKSKKFMDRDLPSWVNTVKDFFRA